jgi:hypothetical protein
MDKSAHGLREMMTSGREDEDKGGNILDIEYLYYHQNLTASDCDALLSPNNSLSNNAHRKQQNSK